MRCAVYGCNNNNSKNKKPKNTCSGVVKDGSIKYFRFPKDESTCRQWEIVCGREKVIAKNSRICSIHFCEEDFQMKYKLNVSSGNSRILKKGAIPKLFLPKEPMELTSQFVNDSLKWQQRDSGNSSACELLEIQSTKQRRHAENMKIKMLEQELKMEQDRNRQLEVTLSKIFTPGQIHKLKNPKLSPKWSVDDIADCFAIYSSGPQAYQLLLKKHYPLVDMCTLRAWSNIMKIPHDIIKQL